jgi:GTP-binding protein
VALNKVDVPEARDLAELVRPDLERRGLRAFPISAASHEGLRELTYALAEAVEADRATRPSVERPRIVLHPEAVDAAGFTVTEAEDGFVVRGDKPERWVKQTNFDNDEAVGYLADRLKRLGVEDELTRRGAQPGAAVTIGDVTFDFEPTGGADYQPTRRGADGRLDAPTRTRAAERLAAKRARRAQDEDDSDA